MLLLGVASSIEARWKYLTHRKEKKAKAVNVLVYSRWVMYGRGKCLHVSWPIFVFICLLVCLFMNGCWFVLLFVCLSICLVPCTCVTPYVKHGITDHKEITNIYKTWSSSYRQQQPNSVSIYLSYGMVYITHTHTHTHWRALHLCLGHTLTHWYKH